MFVTDPDWGGTGVGQARPLRPRGACKLFEARGEEKAGDAQIGPSSTAGLRVDTPGKAPDTNIQTIATSSAECSPLYLPAPSLGHKARRPLPAVQGYGPRRELPRKHAARLFPEPCRCAEVRPEDSRIHGVCTRRSTLVHQLRQDRMVDLKGSLRLLT